MSAELELERIRGLADRLYSDFDAESRVEDKDQLLAAILRNLEPNYFNRAIYERQSTAKLLEPVPVMAEKAKILYRFIGSSNLSGLLKAHVCADAASFLKNVCNATAEELEQLREVFDVGAFMEEFWTTD